ncbi:hypothetical protein SAMN04487906_2405 [Zhouia amylolytica]|uniref:Uncharacterized protein n=2 Tax=Zhouia amylolytica TaxID=376730 RepID=W2UMY6_9FLAO|nr:hypothetical protein [Zhouia amylolytica]ETN95304.1 hypothetical protein P278_10260 [Zhouia amylolytica AD3]MCQ0112454.1 hypothetical protein [Zhouia amylolytica]SFS99572.1 hypothetical protein SAMN04487906_2405 [Zhouia amylolytica]
MEKAKTFDSLDREDRELLLKAPVLVSFMAATKDNIMDAQEKADALDMAHLRTFTANPKLQPYYMEVEKRFKPLLKEMIEMYLPMNEYTRKTVKEEINKINELLGEMDKEFATLLHKSLNSYAEHVRKADRNVLEYFMIPFIVPGINEL